MSNLGTLTLDLVAKTGNFIQGMDKSERSVKKFVDSTAKGAKIAAGAITAMATASAAAAVALTKQGMDAVRSQADLARSLDTTFDSITALQLAAGDVGLEGLEGSLTRLNRRLGAAEVGSGAAANAVKALRLDLQALSKMDVDERVATIADAIRDSGVSMQRAARFAQDLGFEQRQAAEFFTQGGDAIRSYRERVEALGLSLSDIDAQKVVDAQNAMGIFGDLTRGASQALAVELSPIIQQIAIELEDAAIEAGGMGNAVQEAVQTGVKALAFMADAADGVKRVFQLVADGIILILNEVAATAALAAYRAVEMLNAIPGVDFSDELKAIGDFGRQANSVVKLAAENMQATLDEPLAGEKLLAFYEKAQKAGQEAAESAVAAAEANRKSGEVSTKAIKNQRDAIGDLIKSLELESATVGMSRKEQVLYKAELDGANASQIAQVSALLSTIVAHEEADKAAKAYADTVKSLRTDEEKLTDEFHERVAVLDAMADSYRISSDEYHEMASRAAASAFEGAPEFAGLAPEVAGPWGELNKIDKAEEELQEWYDTQLEMLEEFRTDRADLNAQWDEQDLALKKEHEDELARIEQARQMAQLAAAESVFGDLAGLARTFAGEQSGIYKAMFAVQKAASIAQSMVAIQTGIALAAANPWPTNLAAMASVAAATASIVGNIGAIGMAHDGLDRVPQTGTWLLEKGERVVTSNTSDKLDRTLDSVRRSNYGGGGNNFNAVVNVQAVDGMSAEAARQQGNQISEGMTRQFDRWLADRMQPGGPLWQG